MSYRANEPISYFFMSGPLGSSGLVTLTYPRLGLHLDLPHVAPTRTRFMFVCYVYFGGCFILGLQTFLAMETMVHVSNAFMPMIFYIFHARTVSLSPAPPKRHLLRATRDVGFLGGCPLSF